MKKTFKLFAAVVAALVCTISCELNPIELQNAVSEGNTFTATIGQKAPAAAPSTKITVDDAGKCAWSEGDKIIVYNGNSSENILISGLASATDYVEVITVNESMLSNDNRTVTFSTSLASPESGKKWYFYAMDNQSNMYMIRSNGNPICGAVAKTDNSAIPFVAAASASSASESLTFKHALGYLKMSSSAWTYKVGVYSNSYNSSASGNNEAILQAYDINFPDVTVAGRTDQKANYYECAVNDVGVGKSFYVALTPHTWTNGITIDVFYGTQGSDNWGWYANPKNPAKSVTISTPFSIKAGQIIDMGNILADHSAVTSYYDAWEAGRDIVVNGVKYNKATYGAGTLLTSDTEFTANPSDKVFFLDDGVTFTLNDKTKFYDGLIIIGNTPGARPVLVNNSWTTMFSGKGKTYLFKNLTVTNNASSYGFRFWASTIGTFAIDDCTINGSSAGLLCGDEGNGIDNLSVTNSDWKVAKNGYLTRSYNGGALATVFGTITFNNNVVYADASSSYYTIGFNNDNADGKSSLTKAVMKNNTFINISSYGAGFFYWGCDFAFEADNNLFYYGKELTGNVSLARPMNNSVTLTSVSAGTNYQYQMNSSYSNNFIASWAPRVSFNKLSESPFSSMDFTNGEFTKTSAAASYGATR